jgi:hypothetical protein
MQDPDTGIWRPVLVTEGEGEYSLTKMYVSGTFEEAKAQVAELNKERWASTPTPWEERDDMAEKPTSTYYGTPQTPPRPSRLGPQMRYCLQRVRDGQDLTKYALAVAIGPHHSNNYGDRIVMRCFKAGLIIFDDQDPRAVNKSIGVPKLTDAGRAALGLRLLEES